MVGAVVGVLTVVAHAGKGSHGENVWEARCRCGESVFISTSEIRRRQKRGLVAACASCARSLGRRRAHGKSDSEPIGKMCPACYGLPHRRPKSGCRECREPFAEEVVEHVIPTGGCGLALVIV